MTRAIQGGLVRTLRRPGRTVLVLAALVGGGLSLVGDSTSAQPPDDDRRRALVDELLRSLIDSELEKRDIGVTQPAVPTAPRTNTVPRTNTSVSPGAATRPTREMVEARRVLGEITREADQLTSILNADLQRVPGIRPYMSDVLKLRARAAVLGQRAAQLNDHREIQPDLQNLDRDWQVLAYRLESLRGLDPRAAQHITRLNQYAQTLSNSLNMAKQFDRGALLQKTSALTASLHSLVEDIEIELTAGQQRQQLLLDGRRVEQSSVQLSNLLLDDIAYELVVGEYQQFQGLWTAFEARLRPLNNRYLERGVRRVQESNAGIHELLLLPHQMNSNELRHLTEMLKKDIDDFYARAPMKLLIELPENDRVLPAADHFYSVCENFIANVERGSEMSLLTEEFRYVDGAWGDFDRLMRPLNSRAAQAVLKEIEQRLQSIRMALNVKDGVDHHVSLDLAASLDALADHLQQDMGYWLSRTPVSFRNEALRDAASFAAAAHQLHVDVLNGATVVQVRRDADALHDQWRKVHQWVLRCVTDDRVHLQRISSHVTPALVDLRTLVQ